ncbi:MAG TPA: ATP-binding protein [Solirubrobacteraceae bacterium]|nr:ATP-binding protein [Solirubrobacteraceae bacterium]
MTPDMELTLAARAENIAIVRHALGGLGEAFAVSEPKLSDIRLAVTEACANVVVHAYPDDHEGLMEVVASMDDDELTVLVRDWGRGIRPRPDSPGLGLGLSLIAALAETV